MHWLERYKAKLKTPQEAVRLISSGQRVYVHPGCAVPEVLVERDERTLPRTGGRGGHPPPHGGQGRLLRAGDGRPLPSQRRLHRRERAEGGQRGEGGLHAGLSERDPRHSSTGGSSRSTSRSSTFPRPTNTVSAASGSARTARSPRPRSRRSSSPRSIPRCRGPLATASSTWTSSPAASRPTSP